MRVLNRRTTTLDHICPPNNNKEVNLHFILIDQKQVRISEINK